MDCARLNFSHGDHEGHLRIAQQVRKAASEARRPLAILADLSGPKMRIGRFKSGEIRLDKGDTFVLTTRKIVGTQAEVSVSYAELPSDVNPGDFVALDDGWIGLRVTEVRGQDVVTEVESGGVLSDRKGLNLPGVAVSTPSLTDKDKADLVFALQQVKVDYIALSFVRKVEDVRQAKALAGDTPVIAKIEKPEAVDVLEDIVAEADGVMIARGDLGVEMGSEKVPMIQKRIVREANQQGKIVITATQMLDSMIRNPRPTRAEAADVANAVMDGTDVVMLSGETAAGHYPVESLQMMDKIIREVEGDVIADLNERTNILESEEWRFPNAAARAAALLCTYLPLKAVVAFTQDGRTAGLLAQYRPRAPILAITHDVQVAQRLALGWGVIPRLEVPPESLDETLRIATSTLVREKLCARGEAFAMVVGWPTSGRTNTVKLHRL